MAAFRMSAATGSAVLEFPGNKGPAATAARTIITAIARLRQSTVDL